MVRRSRSPRRGRSFRRRKTKRTPKRRKSVRGGGMGLPTESECLDLFKDKRPNAGLNPRYSFCKHWLSRKKYLEEAQKRYGKSYGHFSFVPRKLFGKRYSDASGDTKIPGGHVGVQVEIPRDGVDAENQAGSPKVQVASLLSPPRTPETVLPPPPPPPPPPTPSAERRSSVWTKLGRASNKVALGIGQASFIDEIGRVGRSKLKKAKTDNRKGKDNPSVQPLTEYEQLVAKLNKVREETKNDD